MPKLPTCSGFAIFTLLTACAVPAGPSGSGIGPDPLGVSSKADSASDFQDVWESPEACDELVRGGARLPRDPGELRVVSWNLRWFPLGVPTDELSEEDKSTNLPWLACTMTWLNADVFAVQEMMRSEVAYEALRQLRSLLRDYGNGSYRYDLDWCDLEDPNRQHVGLLYDRSRVRVRSVRQSAAINPHGEACEGRMRPGLSAHIELLDGSNAGTDERVNFHLVSAHLKSGGNRYSHGLRQQSLEGIVTTFHERQSIWEDEDMIVAGDLNTLGCWGCDPRLDSAEEVTELRATVEAAEVPFYALTPDVECTFQTGLRGRTLDHFLVSDGPLDLRNNAEVSVQGYCAQDGCTSSVAQSRARKELSDHCPVVLDVR